MSPYAWDKPFFANREEAAKDLADKLREYKGQNPLVLAVPRGAVPMGKVIADALKGELDVVLAHKIGAPDNPEFAVGAVSESGKVYIAPYAEAMGLNEQNLQKEIRKQFEAIQKRRKQYTPFGPQISAEHRIVIIVDDGIATGSTIFAAIREVRPQGPLRIVVAAAVIPPDVAEKLRREADEVVALAVTSDFGAVGEFFKDFGQVTDEEVAEILKSRGAKKPG
ncbi:MAG TPA: phosphoribosyltransferase family protein [bacterium]|nr:phosphoribosyltransferase family protein [bacterium]